MRGSDNIGTLALALANAQAEFGPIAKDKTAKAGAYSYNYADLADILNAVRKPLADNELAVTQVTEYDFNHSRPLLVTRLMHSSGEWIEGVYPLRDYDKPQDMGSALTYARRYALTSLLGIAAEDDDGNSAQQAKGGKDAQAPKPAATNGTGHGTSGRKAPERKAAPAGEVQSQPSGGKEEVAPTPPDQTAEAVSGKGAASAVLVAKRNHLRKLATNAGLDADEWIKPTGITIDDITEVSEMDALIVEMQALVKGVTAVKDGGLV